MILDKLLQVSTSQAIAAASVVSADTVDLGVARDIGEGEDVYMHFNVEVAPTAATSIEFQCIISASANLGTPTVVGTSGAIPIASLPVGTLIPVRINPKIGSLGLRYIGANYVVVGTNTSAGTYSCAIVHGIQDGRKYYPSGITVL
jgi:hypothetical protein